LEGGNAGVPLRGRDRENEIDGYKLREATIDFDLGLTYEQIGNLKEALRYHRKALRIRRQQLNHQEGNLELSEAAVRQLEMRLNSPV
jgi:tetratricopeptide (TPR) repeat protein